MKGLKKLVKHKYAKHLENTHLTGVILKRLLNLTTLGRGVEVEVTEAPELIAGLELDTATAIVRNHFRADLDRITAEVRKHD